MTAYLAPRTRQLLFFAVCIAVVAASIDAAVPVLLPAIGGEFDASAFQLSWIIAINPLILNSLLFAAGRSGDRFGQRRVMTGGIILFGGGSVICALAPTIGVLIVGRALQGVGAAFLGPTSRALIFDTLPPDHRGSAYARFVQITSIGTVGGGLVAGALATWASWRAMFALNALFAIGALSLLAPLRGLPEPERDKGPIGWQGGAALVTALLFAALAVDSASIRGWIAPLTPIWLAIAAGGVAWLVHIQRSSNPYIPLRILHSRTVKSVTFVLTTLSAVGTVVVLLLSFFVQQALGLSPLAFGALLLPAGFGVLAGTAIAGRIFEATGARIPATISLAVTAAGFAVVGIGVLSSSNWMIGAGLALSGVALGFARMLPPYAFEAVPEHLRGRTNAIIGTVRALGATVGAFVAGVALAALTQPTPALTASHAATVARVVLAAAALAAVGAAVAFVSLRVRRNA